MNETDLGADAGDQEPTGVVVDVDAPADKAVTRARPQTQRPQSRQPSWAERSAEMSKDMKRRLERQARGFSQQLAEQQAAHQRQLAEINDKLNKLTVQPTGADETDEAHAKAMEELQERLEAAQERGDSKEVAKITREMSTLEGKYWAAKASKAGVVDKTNQRTDGTANGQSNGAATGTQQRKPTKAGIAWAKANAGWWNDTVDEVAIDARTYANNLHTRKLADGDDPEDPAYFEDIRQQVQKRFPEIQTVSTLRGRRATEDDDDDPETRGEDDAPTTRRAPPSLPNRGDPSQRQRGQSLTRADMATMRQVNLDPNNDKHVVQFLKSKNEVEAEA
jgi:hypothetical protein